MLALILDENISYVVADQLQKACRRLHVTSVHRWEGGRLLASDDETILREAAGAGLTLVTYDVTTIPLLLRRFAEDGITHAGVVLVDGGTIPQRDVGGLVRALTTLWRREHATDWTNRVEFLQRGAVP